MSSISEDPKSQTLSFALGSRNSLRGRRALYRPCRYGVISEGAEEEGLGNAFVVTFTSSSESSSLKSKGRRGSESEDGRV